MHYIVIFLSALGLLFWVHTQAMAVPIEPTSVLLYPSGGQIQATEILPVQEGKIVFDVPAGAKIDTLVIQAEGCIVTEMSTSPAPDQPDRPVVAAIRQKLTEAKTALSGVTGELAGTHTKIKLWTEPSQKITLEEMEKIDAMASERIKNLYLEESAIATRKKAAEKEVAQLERELQDVGGDVNQIGTQAVRVKAALQTTNGKELADKVTIKYSYTLPDCGWSSVYRLDAQPDQKKVAFWQEAEIRQASGQDWSHVALTLVSANFGGLKPATLPEWWVRPAMAEAKTMMADRLEAAPMMATAARGARNVRQEESATGTIWELGQQSLPTGKQIRRPLHAQEWQANFVRVVRPSQQKTAYLRADVRLPESAVFPQGMANYTVDGVLADQDSFSLAGTEKKIYFGTDPRVTAEMKLDTRQSGKTGFIGKKQTRVWSWIITVANHHSTPVNVRVEDSEPQSGDKAIEVNTTASKELQTENHIRFWTLNIPAGKTETLKYQVDVSAPADMRLIDGRR